MIGTEIPKIEVDIELLKELVEIHSGSKNIDGVNRVQTVLERQLISFGFKVQRIKNPSSSHRSGDLLLAQLPGSTGKWIDLITHADTVEEGVSEKTDFRLDPKLNTAIGRGALDDKAAQVQVLQALKVWIERLGKRDPLVGIRLISAPSEELGSPGFHDFFENLGKTSSFALGFEPALEDGAIISSRRGNRWYRVEVKGHGGHSGRSHRAGVNAALDLSKKFVQASALTDYGRDISVSIGSIQTSTQTYNVICDEAVGKLDTRFAQFRDRDELDGKLRAIFSQSTKSEDGKRESSTQVTLDDDCPPFEESAESEKWQKKMRSILEKIEGTPIRAQRSGGAADCCYMSRKGLRIIDGLGPRGGRMHEADEFVHLSSISDRARALIEFLEVLIPELGKESP